MIPSMRMRLIRQSLNDIVDGWLSQMFIVVMYDDDIQVASYILC